MCAATYVNLNTTGEAEGRRSSLNYPADSFVFLSTLSVYVVLLCLSLCANVLVVFVIVSNRRMRRGVNMFVLSLAVADVLYCSSGLVFTPVTVLMNHWFGGEALCKLIPTTAALSVFVISLTAMAIAIERCLRASAQRRILKTFPAALVNFSLWTVSTGFCLPIAMHSQAEEGRCVESWTEDQLLYRRVFSLFCVIMQFIVPAIVIALCYVRVIRIFESHYRVAMSSMLVVERSRVLKKLKRRTMLARLAVSIIATFIILFTPLNAFNLLAEYSQDVVNNSDVMPLVYIAAHAMTSTATVANPVLYCYFNTDFQKYARRYWLLRALFRLRETNAESNSTSRLTSAVITQSVLPSSAYPSNLQSKSFV